MAADGLQLVQTSSGNVFGDRDDSEGLKNLPRELEEAEGKKRTLSRKSTRRINSNPWRFDK